MESVRPIIILGNGGAAISAVMELRQSGYSGEIHLVSDSIWPSYNPMLTSYYAAGKLPLENCFPFGGFEIYQKYNVDLHLGSPVMKLDAEKQIVKTANGHVLDYSQALIATGASPILPNIPGIQNEKILTLRTLEDAIKLKKEIDKKPKKVLIVGASMVGIKLVELFSELNVDVTLVDLAPHIFPLAATVQCAEIIQEMLIRKGIRLVFNTGIKEIVKTRKGLQAYFQGELESVETDLIIMCIGVRPNLEFINKNQILCGRGILINEKMQTNVPNTYAAGDIAQGNNLLNNKKEVIGLWANARFQGRTAGRNMAGVNDIFPGSIPQNITHFMNMDFVGIGDLRNYQEIKIQDTKAEKFCCLAWDDNKLNGINLLNKIEYAGVYRNLLIKKLCQSNVKDTSTFPWSALFNFDPNLITK